MTGSEPGQLKILLISTSFPLTPSSTSGMFVKYLYDALSERCYVQALTPDDNRTDTSALERGISAFRYAPKKWQKLAHLPGGIPAQLQTNRLAFLLVPFFLLSFFFHVFVMSRKVDVVHANWAISGFVAGLVKYFRPFVLLTTLRGEDVKENLGLLNRFFLKQALRHSDSVVLVSQDMSDLLSRIFPQFRHKLYVIHNGVSSAFQAGVYKPQRENRRLKRAVFVGSLIERKNVQLLLHALSVVNRDESRCELFIAGEGAQQPDLKTLCDQLKLSSEVTFLGAVGHDDLTELLSGAEFYVSASMHEGRPNSVIEAMAAGCCIVISDISGHRELVGDNERGRLFDLSSAQCLATELTQLLNDPALINEYAGQAKQYVIDERLTWSSCAEHYCTLYKHITARRL